MSTQSIIDQMFREGRKMQRISKDEYYMDIAMAVSKRATCLRRKFGAIIVNNDEIVATGYNGAPRGEKDCLELNVCERQRLNIPSGERYELCRSIHAEQNAIISAARKETIGATIYIAGTESASGEVTNSTPCKLCRRYIKNAGITRVVARMNGVTQDIDIWGPSAELLP
jgi:dCMP deaminase